MSLNLIFNGDFSLPIITTDTFLYSSNFATDEQNNLYWFYGPYTAIQNGNTVFSFPDPILINDQFWSIQYTNYIQQSFSMIIPGSYRLSFHYAV